jgi:hypothetical protein
MFDLQGGIREKWRKTKHPKKRRKINGNIFGLSRMQYKTPEGVYIGYELTLHKGEVNYSPYGILGAWYATLFDCKGEARWFMRQYPDKYDGYTITRIRVDEDGFRVDDHLDEDIEIMASYRENEGANNGYTSKI